MKYVVVGAGPTGCAFARIAAEAGHQVEVFDARAHVGGNCYDEYDYDTGVLKHVYGPHIFRTNDDSVMDFLKRFAEWKPQEYRLLSQTRTKRYQWPINLTTLEQFWECGTLTAEEAEKRLAQEDGVGEFPDATSSEELTLNRFGKRIYETFFEAYTRKQWGIRASRLAPEVCARVVNPTLDRYPYAVRGKYMCMPEGGFTRLFQRVLDHENIEVNLRVELMPADCARIYGDRVVWTGALDAAFMWALGKLPYRGVELRWCDEPLRCLGTVFPDGRDPLTRAIDIRHITGQLHLQPCTSYEYPTAEGEPAYPMPTRAAQEKADQYRKLAKEAETEGFYCAGRLGTYKYINTDEAVAQAMALAKRIL